MQQKNRQQHGLRLQLSKLRQNIDLGSDPKYQGTEQENDRENVHGVAPGVSPSQMQHRRKGHEVRCTPRAAGVPVERSVTAVPDCHRHTQTTQPPFSYRCSGDPAGVEHREPIDLISECPQEGVGIEDAVALSVITHLNPPVVSHAVPELSGVFCSPSFIARSPGSRAHFRRGWKRDGAPGQLRLTLQQVLEIGERPVGIRWLVFAARHHLRRCVSDLLPRVLIIVTVETQQLPVATIGGIVVVVVVFMMDRELTQLFAVKFAPAPRTDPGIHFERLPPIGLLLLRLVAPRFGDYAVLAVEI
jgi:hypothetical protein